MAARLVSIGSENGFARVRRYEHGTGGRPLLTHDGSYDPQTLTRDNIYYYLANGAPQDLVRKQSHAA